MGRPILVRGARQLLTLQGPPGPRRGNDLRNLGLVQDGSVLILDGRVRDVGSTRRLENLAVARDAIEINAAGRVVMPGFVDSHAYLVSGPSRLAEFEAMIAGEPKESHMNVSRGIETTSGSTLAHRALRTLQDCVREGTTMIEAKSGFGLSPAGELKTLRIHALLHEQPIPVVSTAMLSREFEGGPLEYLARVLPVVRRRHLAEFVDVEYDEGGYGYEECREFLRAARRLGFGLKLHGGERSQTRVAELALETGATNIAQLIFVNPAQIALLAREGVIATLLPGSVFYLGGDRYAPARKLIDAGVPVAIATNYNPRTCPSHNMQMMIALACRAMRMSPAEAISAATINGAHALRRANRVGSIEYGKDADLVVLSAPDYRELPYHFGVNLVETTICRGEVIYNRAEVTVPKIAG
ncbi:MAG: amidohydrolase family protein [Bryobacteraceae bacterium]|jgi:imidazolonepropionase